MTVHHLRRLPSPLLLTAVVLSSVMTAVLVGGVSMWEFVGRAIAEGEVSCLCLKFRRASWRSIWTLFAVTG